MNKKLIVRIAVITCAVLVVFTFLSKTVYGLTIPSVSTAEAERAFVPLSAKATGEIYCESAVEINAGESWRIDELFIKNGMRVEAGDLLFTLDTYDMEMDMMSLELDILRLQNNLDELRDSTNNLKTERLTAPFNGVLLETATVDRKLVQDMYVGRYIDDSAFVVSAAFIESYREKIRTGMKAQVTMPEWMYSVEGTVISVSDSGYIPGRAGVIMVNVQIDNPGALTENEKALVEITAADGEVMLATEPGAVRFVREMLLYAPMSGIVSENNMKNTARYQQGSTLLAMYEEAQTENARSTQRTRDELNIQLEIAKKRLEKYQYIPDGQVFAEVAGMISGIAVKERDLLQKDTILFYIQPDDAPLEVRFSLPVDVGETFSVGSQISAEFNTIKTVDDSTTIVKKKSNSDISKVTLSDDGSVLEFSAQLKETNILMGGVAEVSVSERGEAYDITVPAASVSDRGSKKAVYYIKERNGLFGIEYYVVETEVTVDRGNTNLSALGEGGITQGMQVVTYSSRPLIDGETVKVKQP